jgi:hypothetical protein
MIKNLQHIYESMESMNIEPDNTITGGLKFYKYNFVKDPNIPILSHEPIDLNIIAQEDLTK